MHQISATSDLQLELALILQITEKNFDGLYKL